MVMEHVSRMGRLYGMGCARVCYSPAGNVFNYVRHCGLVSDIYPIFIEPTITWVPSGFSGYLWLDTKIVLKNLY